MLHAIGKILYFVIWVLVFKAGSTPQPPPPNPTPQPPEGGAGEDQTS
jgi:hypothetical protein